MRATIFGTLCIFIERIESAIYVLTAEGDWGKMFLIFYLSCHLTGFYEITNVVDNKLPRKFNKMARQMKKPVLIFTINIKSALCLCCKSLWFELFVFEQVFVIFDVTFQNFSLLLDA
jgi:hypothetical protein